ncbi:MAG: uroporphyrinogen-III C-methyltransferase [Burkholderiales bacterium]|nr:uroporphyrinogen-III C-methyltransferase [Burkholderiales bacterium]
MAKVIFIGAGPGASDLMTVRGARRLAQAGVVLFDALTDPALRELAPQAEWIDVGKRGYAHAMAQERINALLVEHGLRQDITTVVRLKGGDASLFGRLEEELQALDAAGIDCEVVPGVTAAIAAAAGTRRPLTRRGVGRSVSFATAMTRTGDVHACRSADTEVFYMAGQKLAVLAEQLQQAGWSAQTPVLAVSCAGTADERASEHSVASLPDAGERHAGRPTVVIVGAGALPVRPEDAGGGGPLSPA